LKTSTYDVTGAGRDTFIKTTQEITEYIGRTYEDAGEFCTGMVELLLPDLVSPPVPKDDASPVQLEIWRQALRWYEEQKKIQKKNTNRAFALVLGQCSQAVRNRMEANKDWAEINGASDVIKLLGLIQTCMTLRQTRQYDVHALIKAELRMYMFKQGKHMSNHDYYEKFRDNVTTVERLGGEVGTHASWIIALLKGIADPTTAQKVDATWSAKDRYLAVLFLLRSDQNRYGGLVRDIKNEYTRGTNSYPLTLTAAYDYLVNYQAEKQARGGDGEGGLAFYTSKEQQGDEGNSAHSGGQGPGCGNSGRGGQGGRGGRGGCRAGKPQQYVTDDQQDDAQYLLDNADNLVAEDVEGYSLFLRIEHCYATSSFQKGDLLLDSCSTVNLIANPRLLHDIHTVPTTMRVCCNAGVRTTNKKGWLGKFPGLTQTLRQTSCHCTPSRNTFTCDTIATAMMHS
jgi:hypothetical protein